MFFKEKNIFYNKNMLFENNKKLPKYKYNLSYEYKKLFLQKKICIISGGGTNIYKMLGCLATYYNSGLLKTLYEGRNDIWLVGTSAGALIAFVLSMNLNIQELSDYVYKDILPIKIIDIGPKSIITLPFLGYISNNKDKKNLIADILKFAKLSVDITFEELYAINGKNLVIIGCDYQKNTIIYMSKFTTPNVKVIDAINASSNVPILWKSTLIEIKNTKYYVSDGALLANYGNDLFNPLSLFYLPKDPYYNHDKLPPLLTQKNTFGIVNATHLNLENNTMKSKKYVNIIKTFLYITKTLLSDQNKSLGPIILSQSITINISEEKLSALTKEAFYIDFIEGCNEGLESLKIYETSAGKKLNNIY